MKGIMLHWATTKNIKMCCGFRIFGIVLAGENVTLLFVKHFFSKGQLVSTVTLTQRRDSPERALCPAAGLGHRHYWLIDLILRIARILEQAHNSRLHDGTPRQTDMPS